MRITAIAAAIVAFAAGAHAAVVSRRVSVPVSVKRELVDDIFEIDPALFYSPEIDPALFYNPEIDPALFYSPELEATLAALDDEVGELLQ